MVINGINTKDLAQELVVINGINTKDLAQELRDIRDEAKKDRRDRVVKVLYCLEYNNNTSVSIPEFDSFLVRAVSDRFGVSINRDIILMAFGLLQGYSYTEMGIGERRKKYLSESNYLQTRSRKQAPYNGATDKQKADHIDKLRKAEDTRISNLAVFLAKQNVDEYIKKDIAPIAMPEPSYLSQRDFDHKPRLDPDPDLGYEPETAPSPGPKSDSDPKPIPNSSQGHKQEPHKLSPTPSKSRPEPELKPDKKVAPPPRPDSVFLKRVIVILLVAFFFSFLLFGAFRIDGTFTTKEHNTNVFETEQDRPEREVTGKHQYHFCYEGPFAKDSNGNYPLMKN